MTPRRPPSETHRDAPIPRVVDAATLLPVLLAPLREQMSLFAFRGFLEPLLPAGLAFDDDGPVRTHILTLWAPSAFLADWVRDHYGAALVAGAQAALGGPVTVTIIERPATLQSAADAPASGGAQDEDDDDDGDGARVLPLPVPLDRERARAVSSLPRHVDAVPGGAGAQARGRRLDPRYTFDSFVAGNGNEMAFSAAWSVAERPGARYSPLFLFGPTGLGKTHLLHSIGHEILTRHQHLRVASLSAEQWVNDFIQGAHEKRFDAFRRRFRDDIDVLLIDDIQFLAGKSQSQDEFFHTFNALYEAHKQIVVTSDRYPHEIAGLEDRLKTRFQWGLVADVRPPDADTRRAILVRKASDLGCALPNDVADFVSSSITTSVRALEGALMRLCAWSQLTREPITLKDTREQLQAMLQAGAQSPVSSARVIEIVAAYHGMKVRDLVGPSRQRQVTRARQIAIWLCRQHLQLSFPELGRAFDRDHTTALASVQKIDGLAKTDAGIKAVIARLEQSLF
jgi:chromosomal replication initiator protein DnaA